MARMHSREKDRLPIAQNKEASSLSSAPLHSAYDLKGLLYGLSSEVSRPLASPVLSLCFFLGLGLELGNRHSVRSWFCFGLYLGGEKQHFDYYLS